MAICYSPADARGVPARAARGRVGPLLLDRFLEEAVELDVDALCDGETAGPPASWSTSRRRASTRATRPACRPPRAPGRAGRRAGGADRGARPRPRRGGPPQRPVRGPARRQRLVIEANPRASRTIPFVAKATGVPLVRHAVRLMLGASLGDLDLPAAAPHRAGGGEGGGAALRAVPRRRPGARAGDARHGRGDGARRHVPEAFAKAQRGAGQSPAARGRRVHLGPRRRQAPEVAVAARLARGRPRPRLATGGRGRPGRRRPAASSRSEGHEGSPHVGRPVSPRAGSTLSSTRPGRAPARGRTATSSARPPSAPACPASRRSRPPEAAAAAVAAGVGGPSAPPLPSGPGRPSRRPGLARLTRMRGCHRFSDQLHVPQPQLQVR